MRFLNGCPLKDEAAKPVGVFLNFCLKPYNHSKVWMCSYAVQTSHEIFSWLQGSYDQHKRMKKAKREERASSPFS